MNHPSEFFQALYQNIPDGYLTEIRMLPEGGGKPTRIYRPANRIHEGNFDVLAEFNQTMHIYHRMALSTESLSKKADIRLLSCLWLDIDGKELSPNDFIDIDYPPTLLLDSGGGYHLYWLFKTPLAIETVKDIELIERTMQGMILAFGGNADPKAKDITRILRTPFFKNIKEKYAPEYPECTVLWYDDSLGDRYKFEWLHQSYAPLGAPAKETVKRQVPITRRDESQFPKWIQEYLASGEGQGGRNQRLYAVSRWFNDNGYSQHEAESHLLGRAMTDGLPQHEASTTIRSAYRNAPNPVNAINQTRQMRYALGDSLQGHG